MEKRGEKGGADCVLLPMIVVISALFASASHGGALHWKGLQATHIFLTSFSLEPGDSMLCWTDNSTPGTDPAMHLWNSGLGEVAFGNDNGSSKEASFSYTNSSSGRRNYTLIVRSDQNESFVEGYQGLTDLTCIYFGQQLNAPDVSEDDIPVGGILTFTPADPGDVTEVGSRPGGPLLSMVLALDNQGHLLDYDIGGGVGSMARLEAPPSTFISVVGGLALSSTAMTSLGDFPETEGLVDVYLNDLGVGGGNDADGDGLGAGLESLIDTCDSTTTNAYCATIPNLQDSDRDGLRDDWEVFGEDRPSPQPDNLFAYWGADPAQMDIFIEIDWLSSAGQSVSLGTYTQNPFEVDGDSDVQWLFDIAQEPYSLGSAADLGNPNDKLGINLHFDVGYEPQGTSDAWQYAGGFGDWGGGGTPVNFNSDGDYIGEYEASMSAARRGRFHYGVAFNGGGGVGVVGTPPAFRFGYDTNNTGGSAAVLAHELGHTMKLSHNHDTSSINCNPIYFSLMNYRFDYVYPLRFSMVDEADSGTVNAARAREYSDLTTDNFPADPAIPSRYVDMFTDRFSPFYEKNYDGELKPNETFDEFTDPEVDWNQDGVHGSNPGTTVDPAIRSQLLVPQQGGCKMGFSGERVSVEAASQTDPVSETPALVFNGDNLYSLFVKDGQIFYTWTPIVSLADASCLNGADFLDSDCHVMLYEFPLTHASLGTDVESVRAVREISNTSGGAASNDLRIAVTKTNGDIVVCDGEVNTGAGPVSIGSCSSPLFPEPATAAELGYVHERNGGVKTPKLALYGTFDLVSLGDVVVYRVLDGVDYTDDSDWSDFRILLDSSGDYLSSATGSAVSVAAWPPIEDFGAAPSNASTCLAVQEPTTDEVAVYCTEDFSQEQRWKPVGKIRLNNEYDFGHPPTIAEPWLEFTRERLANGHRRWSDPRIGRFVLTYVRANDSSSGYGEYRYSDLMGPRANSQFKEYSPAGPNAWRFDYGTVLGDVDAGGSGISVLDHSGIGATKALVSERADDNNSSSIQLKWAFDGAVDQDWTAYNDFKRMAEHMCAQTYHTEDTDPGGFVCD